MAGPIKISFLADVGQAVKSVTKFSETVDSETKRVVTSLGDSKLQGGFGKVQEGFDVMDTRMMGFRDTITGVQDSMTGFQMVSGETQKAVDGLQAQVNTATAAHDGLTKELSRQQAALSAVNKAKDPNGYALLAAGIENTKAKIDASSKSLGDLNGQLSTAKSKTGTLWDGMFTLGMGLGDAASGAANLIVPMLAVGTALSAQAAEAGISTVALIGQKAAMIASTVVTAPMTAAQWLLNAALTANPIGLVILAIVALVAALVLAYNKSSTFRAIINSLGATLKMAAQAVWDFVVKAASYVSGLPGRIGKVFLNANVILANAGRAIMDGLWNGLVSGWKAVQQFLSNVTSWIPDWKGPKSKDKTLLTENGRLIMGGLLGGLEGQYGAVRDSLGGFTDSLAGAGSASVTGAVVVTTDAPAWAQRLEALLAGGLVITVDSTGSGSASALLDLIKDNVRIKGGKGELLGITG